MKNKTKLIPAMILLIINYCSTVSDSTKKNQSSVEWGSYLGRPNWNDANAKCKSLGMRIPSVNELETAYKSGTTTSWKKDSQSKSFQSYWSSNYDGSDGKYIVSFDISDGSTGAAGIEKIGLHDIQLHLRCIK